MKFDIDKYLNQIDAEEKQTQRYKNIGMHIFISFLTVILFITVLAIFKFNRLDENNEKILNGAEYIYVYTAMNTDGLMDYCSATDYIPQKYIALFYTNFKNTIIYSDSILNEYYNIEQKGHFKERARQNSIDMIDKDFKDIKKEYPQIKKIEYCKMYDYEPEKFVKMRIEFFKENHADLFKD